MTKLTSQEWLNQPQYREYKILSPDGWDTYNFPFSFRVETISEDEFRKRLMNSSIESR